MSSTPTATALDLGRRRPEPERSDRRSRSSSHSSPSCSSQSRLCPVRPRVDWPLDPLAVQAFDACVFERFAVPAAAGSDLLLVNLFRAPMGVPNPLTVVRRCHELLRPGAIALVATSPDDRADSRTVLTPARTARTPLVAGAIGGHRRAPTHRPRSHGRLRRGRGLAGRRSPRGPEAGGARARPAYAVEASAGLDSTAVQGVPDGQSRCDVVGSAGRIPLAADGARGHRRRDSRPVALADGHMSSDAGARVPRSQPSGMPWPRWSSSRSPSTHITFDHHRVEWSRFEGD